MYPVSQNYIAAIENGSIQHIICIIREISGIEHVLGYEAEGSDEIVGMPVINRQCVEDTEVFCFGQMYVGTAEVTVSMTGISEDVFFGGELELRFGVEVEGSEEPEWIPLGVWDISQALCEAKTGDTRQIKISALDRLNRLKCTGYNGIGLLYLDTIMQIIEEDAGVEFAQTPAEVLTLIGKPRGLVFRAQMSGTCWDEVKQIAQLMGGFACTDRQGRIVFRKFPIPDPLDPSADIVYSIAASRRFSATLSEHRYSIGTLTYSSGGYSYTGGKDSATSSYSAALGFSDNGYISANADDYAEVFKDWVDPILAELKQVHWFPGTVSYYGNPALDIGDMITVNGGIASQPRRFLICAETWQFRGPQTLIAPGLSESGSSSSGGSSGGTAVASSINIIVEKVINTLELEKLPGTLYEAERTIARGAYSCKSSPSRFINVGIVMLAEEDCIAGAVVYHDEIAQEFRPVASLHAGEYTSLTFTIPIAAAAGTHDIRVAAYGKAEVTDILAHIWGQELTAQSPEYTSASDYTYTIEDGRATVTGYLGTSLYPEIPPRFEGASTAIIGAAAFTDSDITDVYIPEGVTEIRSESGSLPAEYQQVEYLESTGTQYIELPGADMDGVYEDPRSSTLYGINYIECKACESEDYSIFGWYQTLNLTGSGDYYRMYGYGLSSQRYTSDVRIDLNVPHIFKLDVDKFYIDGVLKYTFSRVTSGVGRDVEIFRRSATSPYRDQGGHVRIYYIKWGRVVNGKTILDVDAVPCIRKADGKPGMYDLVSKSFLVNSGTGEFLYSETSSGGEDDKSGAFMNAHDLAHVYIPRTCEEIGEWAFTNTALKKVRIPADCTYYETSFPPGCEIEFYGGGGDYGQLCDGDGYAVLDGDGARIYIGE